MTTGHRLVCKEFLYFGTMPCRPMPLLDCHFWDDFQSGGLGLSRCKLWDATPQARYDAIFIWGPGPTHLGRCFRSGITASFWIFKSKCLIPDPGALMFLHAYISSEQTLDLLWFRTWFYVFGCGIRDPRFEVLRIEIVRTDMYVCVCVCVWVCIISLSLSLSPYIYIYIYTCTHLHAYMHTCIHAYMHT